MPLPTVPQLRERIGGAVAFRGTIGHVLDADLAQILAEEQERLDGLAAMAARQRLLAGENLLVGKAVPVEVAPSGYMAGLLEGRIPTGFFPFAFNVATPDGSLAYDPQIEVTARSQIVPMRRFDVRGETLLVLHPDAECDNPPREVTCYLATGDEVAQAVTPDLVAEATDRAVEKAHQMLQRRIKELGRQELDAGL